MGDGPLEELEPQATQKMISRMAKARDRLFMAALQPPGLCELLFVAGIGICSA
jgi:hypothetical protein